MGNYDKKYKKYSKRQYALHLKRDVGMEVEEIKKVMDNLIEKKVFK